MSALVAWEIRNCTGISESLQQAYKKFRHVASDTPSAESRRLLTWLLPAMQCMLMVGAAEPASSLLRAPASEHCLPSGAPWLACCAELSGSLHDLLWARSCLCRSRLLGESGSSCRRRLERRTDGFPLRGWPLPFRRCDSLQQSWLSSPGLSHAVPFLAACQRSISLYLAREWPVH